MDHLNTTANMNLNKHNLIIPGVGINFWLVQTKLFRSTPAERKLVNIISWNINGLTPDKLSKNVLGSFLEDYDIILLCETWASEQNDFILEGFRYFNYPRKYKHHATKRNSGGLGLFIRNELQNGVNIWTNTDDVIAWIILRKSSRLRNQLHFFKIIQAVVSIWSVICGIQL